MHTDKDEPEKLLVHRCCYTSGRHVVVPGVVLHIVVVVRGGARRGVGGVRSHGGTGCKLLGEGRS